MALNSGPVGLDKFLVVGREETNSEKKKLAFGRVSARMNACSSAS
ncbi:MAG: hypothetical protein JWQ42_4016 [Edaphobacter sp.]|nr:hypothetical protein [Edaphobacter sp.]